MLANSPVLTAGGGVRCAYADESFQEANTGGYCVVAVAVFEPGGGELARDVLISLRGRRRSGGKLHWNEMESAE